MISETLAQADVTAWPKSALILFFVFFVLVCCWVWIRGRGKGYDAVANLPLERDEVFSSKRDSGALVEVDCE